MPVSLKEQLHLRFTDMNKHFERHGMNIYVVMERLFINRELQPAASSHKYMYVCVRTAFFDAGRL